MQKERRRRFRSRPILIVLAVFVLFAGTFGFVFFHDWAQIVDAERAAADLEFAAAIEAAGGGEPYIEILPVGGAVIHREFEPAEPERFGSLTLMAWAPGDEKLLRVDYPHWFVYLKTSTSWNLGTAISLFRRDWEHVDLSVRYGDLRKRGPGLVVDHRLQSGARVVLVANPAN